MKLLPKEHYRIELIPDEQAIAVGIYEHPEGVVWTEKYEFSDLPNDYISIEDLKRFGVNLVDNLTIRG